MRLASVRMMNKLNCSPSWASCIILARRTKVRDIVAHLPLKELSDCEYFIETGTGLGDGIDRALSIAIPSIQSIELDLEFYRLAYDKFRNNLSVRLYYGSSPDVLSHIIVPQPNTVFWLDAHWSGGMWGKAVDEKYGQCPLLAELKTILSFKWDVLPLILVDDAGFFVNGAVGNYHVEDYPTLEQIKIAVVPMRVEIDSKDDYLRIK